MKILIQAALLVAILFTSQICWSQHTHIAAGAESQAQGAKLFFVNGDSTGTNSGYLLYLNQSHALYPGLYLGESPFIALPATISTGGPTPFAAAQGAYLEVQVESVSGPPGGSFSVWQENESGSETRLKFSVATGEKTGKNKFNISEGIIDPEPDPFGHLHTRRLTVNKPGLYTLGLRILDTSTAGTNGGPIHSPSDLFSVYVQAGLTISSFTKTNNIFSVTFGKDEFHKYYLQRTSTLGDTNSWTTVAGPIGDANDTRTLLLTLADGAAASSPMFYRIQCTNDCHHIEGN
jgi:hypothetical protein